jgi:RNA polymerase sigma-70 factor (ECF subfamily)
VWDATDDALLAGFASGDPAAQLVFVRRFQDRAFGLALVLTGDRSLADEVAQDAMVRAWRYGASYDVRRGSVVGWLLAIVRNVALDHLRVRGRKPEDAMADLPVELLVDDSDAATVAAQHDDVAHVLAALRTLPREQREAVVAVTLRGLSGREYSDAADLPLGTVKTRVRLGLRKLRDELGVVAR